MAISSEYSLADIAVATGNDRNNSGMWGGDWSAWIIIFLIFALDSAGNVRYNGYANGEQNLHTLRICNSKGNGRFYRPFSFFAFFKNFSKKC